MLNIHYSPAITQKIRTICLGDRTVFSLFSGALVLLLAGCGSSGSDGSGGLKLTKAVNVFGVNVQSTDSVTDEQILHAASILAEYLDSDEDGVPNNPEVAEFLSFVDATMILAYSQDELDWTIRSNESPSEFTVVVYVDEAPSTKSETQTFDPALREVIHLVSSAGFAEVYPDIFGTSSGSALANAMDTARGGQFLKIPAQYPASAWFTNSDTSCDYGCQVTQYFYWAMTSMLGAQGYPGRLEEIQGEWLLNTLGKVRDTDTAVYAILTNGLYGLPYTLPDGTYKGGVITLDGASE